MQITTAQGNIHFVYDATGRKWAKSGPEGLRWYVDNAEFLDGKIQHVAFPDGRFVAEYDENGTFQGTYRAEYFRTDHLGNTRLAFSDFNHDMVISPRIPSGTPTAYDSEITSENHYYPFGLGHTGPWHARVMPENRYLYNGKELMPDFGLNWYAYGYRHYDMTLGRFTGLDPIAEKFPHVNGFNYAENRPINGIDLHGLQYVNFNESFYSISMGQTWAHANKVQSGRDIYGISYTGTSVPVQQVRFVGGNSKLPLYSGSFARSLQWQGENLGQMYDSAPRTASTNKPDKRFGSTKAYNQGTAAAAGLGKAGLSFIIADLSVSAYTGIKGYKDAVKADEQRDAIRKAWSDVFLGINSGMIAPEFHNIQDLSSVANFVYQGADTFGENDALRTSAINVSKHISGNYRGDDIIIRPGSGLDNYKPDPILFSPPIIRQ